LRLPSLWWLPVGKVPEVTPKDLRRMLAENPALQVVDARTGLEYGQGTIGAARHAPVTGMPDSIEQLNLDPARPVVVLCLSGHRSRPGVRWLRARGFEAYSLKGGVGAWRLAGFPVEPPPKQP
jgi:rhodanese-related sulfurtransferase